MTIRFDEPCPNKPFTMVPVKRRTSRRAAPPCSPRCEGFRRYGGAFSLGPVTWEQCRETATVMLTVKQDDGTQTLPACPTCWEEACNTKGITVIEAKPIAANSSLGIHQHKPKEDS